MRKIIVTVLLVQLGITVNAQTQIKERDTGYYLNPVFAGDYPDPSVLRDGDDYYMVHSSFEYYPGLLIWHSKDLVNWAPVASALHKNVGSVWAPDMANKGEKKLPVNS